MQCPCVLALVFVFGFVSVLSQYWDPDPRQVPAMPLQATLPVANMVFSFLVRIDQGSGVTHQCTSFLLLSLNSACIPAHVVAVLGSRPRQVPAMPLQATLQTLNVFVEFDATRATHEGSYSILLV